MMRMLPAPISSISSIVSGSVVTSDPALLRSGWNRRERQTGRADFHR